uniref:Gamma-glutamyl hydrolase n=1 Tax=Homo sapiens TaxID=9606 RepID=A0A7I2V431_HUMAN
MASPGCLLCVLGLLLCGAASLELSRPHGDTAKKPIIVSEQEEKEFA